MRERLIELIKESFDKPKYEFYTGGRNCAKGYVSAQTIADYLLDNGVIVLPCKVGDTVYVIENTFGNDYTTAYIAEYELTEISYDGRLWTGEFFQFGKEAFTTKEEAEAKLKELKGE